VSELIAGERLGAGDMVYVGDDGRLYRVRAIAALQCAKCLFVKQDMAEGEVAAFGPEGYLVTMTVKCGTEPSSGRGPESWRDRPPML
jgi:hypothetical protein